MLPEDVARRVDSDLASCQGLDGAHGITLDNIDEFRISPTRLAFSEPLSTATCNLWVVLDEMPGSRTEGYLVVFDEVSRDFGLAVKGAPGERGTLIGFYGDLIETLNGM